MSMLRRRWLTIPLAVAVAAAACKKSPTASSPCGWKWTDLNKAGSAASGRPAIDPIGRVFYRTTQGGLAGIAWNGSKWEQIALLPYTDNVRGNPVVVSSDLVVYRTSSSGLDGIQRVGSTQWNHVYLWGSGNITGDPVITGGTIVYRQGGLPGLPGLPVPPGRLNGLYGNGNIIGAGWSWTDLNGAGGYVAEGGLVVDQTGKVFYQRTDGHLNAIYWDGKQWQWTGLNDAGSNVDGDLAVDPTGKIFYRRKAAIALPTVGGTINAIYWDGKQWQWTELNNAGSNASGELVSDAVGKIFYRRTDGTLNAIYWDGSKWQWSGLNSAATHVEAGLAVDKVGKVFYVNHQTSMVNAIYYSC